MAETVVLAAVRPLLRLIRNEARLLRGVRGDVQFIRDEIESVNGFLLNLARTGEHARGDHQVRAWIQQVLEIAYDSNNCVEDYAKSGRMSSRDVDDGRCCWALTRRVKWVVRLPRRLLARRRIAARIRKLKRRVREVSERQQRYAVAFPPLPPPSETTDPTVDQYWSLQAGGGGWRAQDHRRRRSTHPAKDSPRWAVLSGPDILTEAKEELLRWLELKPEDYHTRPWPPSVLAVVTPDGVDGASLAYQLYQHCKASDDVNLKFDRAVCIKIRRPPFLLQILVDMHLQLHPADGEDRSSGDVESYLDLAQITKELKVSLRGKRSLLVFSDLDYPGVWDDIKEFLEKMECSAGSVVVFCTNDKKLANDKCSSPAADQSKVYSLVDFYTKKALSLVSRNYYKGIKQDRLLQSTIRGILSRFAPDVYCMNLLLRALFSNPDRTVQELESLYRSLAPNRCSTKIDKQNRVTTFCYHGLATDHQNCLWYTTAFFRGFFKVRRASLLRKWVAEGLIADAGQRTATDEAERCFDALFTQKLLLPREDGGGGTGTGNVVKSCGLNAPFTLANAEFLDPNDPPPDLQHHFSIRNGIQLLRSMTTTTMESSSNNSISRTEQQMKNVMGFLKSLPSSSSFRLLRVLDLEGFRGFKRRHLSSICKIHQLKYLSLRDTDVVQLPREIQHLVQLETLDVRGTKVRRLHAALPMLKHLLAGRVDYASKSGRRHGRGEGLLLDTTTTAAAAVKSGEVFTTVRLMPPAGVSKMENLEILSHVQVDNNNSGKGLLIGVGTVDNLKKLRKLGVVLSGGKKATAAHQLDDLFREIGELDHTCCLIVSLSIRVEPPVSWDTANTVLLTPPRLLESLTICGVRSRSLPAAITDLHHLIKLTLRDTNLKAGGEQGALAVLGSLKSLLRLRLRYHSFSADQDALVFGQGQFGKLTELVVEDDGLRSLAFAPATAPKLSTMVWSFTRMDSVSGIKNLVSLRRLELNRGTCHPAGLGGLRRDVDAHRNRVRFSLNPPAEN